MKMNKKLFIGVLTGLLALSMVLVLSMVFVSCNNGTGDGDEGTWSAISALSQVNGTWKGTYTSSQSINDWYKQYVDSDGIDSATLAQLGNINVATNATTNIIIDADAGTYSMANTAVMTLSGGNIDTVWNSFKSYLSYVGTVNNADHTVTATKTESNKSITLDALSGCKINDSGNKVKVPANTFYAGIPALTVEKQ
jgi:hypothetical protein